MVNTNTRILIVLIMIAAMVLYLIVDLRKSRSISIPSSTLKPRSILVLDMDETMIHSPPPHDTFIERPFVREFLREIRGSFDELVVFTAATREYASPILDHLDPTRTLFSRRYYRDSCSMDPRTALLVKDLRILGHPLDHVWILDNTPSAYALQPDRGIPIASFEGDPNDRALIDVLSILKEKGRSS